MPQNARQRQQQQKDLLSFKAMTMKMKKKPYRNNIKRDDGIVPKKFKHRKNRISPIIKQQHVEDKLLQPQTFQIPDEQIVGPENKQMVLLGCALIAAWQKDGIFQLQMKRQLAIAARAMEANRQFVQLPLEQKRQFVSERSYAGYIASKEEMTGGKADGAEIFTITKDVPMQDERVQAGWPCHGPVCWPSDEYRAAISTFMEMLGTMGEKLLRLIALGLELPVDTFSKLTVDGWHHMRVLHFPDLAKTDAERGIGAHTDYGMLVLAHQDQVGGLFIRPPIPGEWRPRNWLPTESAAGLYEHDAQWFLVPPCAGTLTCFPGDMLQYLTNDRLLSTPHKVRLSMRERFALAYFHEPNFNAIIRPLNELSPQSNGDKPVPEALHYGTHFTNMFMRCYPHRVTTRRIQRDGGLKVLERMRLEAMANCKG